MSPTIGLVMKALVSLLLLSVTVSPSMLAAHPPLAFEPNRGRQATIKTRWIG